MKKGKHHQMALAVATGSPLTSLTACNSLTEARQDDPQLMTRNLHAIEIFSTMHLHCFGLLFLFPLRSLTDKSPWNISCQVFNYDSEPLGRTFSFSVPTSVLVDKLSKQIFNKLPRDARRQVVGLDTTDLEPWKLSDPIPTTTHAIYQKALANLDFSNSECKPHLKGYQIAGTKSLRRCIYISLCGFRKRMAVPARRVVSASHVPLL